ncbi:MAG: hypothetical protein JWP09_948 [Candidatus Taylorbacteria bacterium]|nr:hypothetical protein [Candidatus Taylorbacteria bacterium]
MAKDQWEEEAIERFREYLSQNRQLTYGITNRDVVVKSGKNFDYQLQNENNEKVAVEIFRLVENEEDLARSQFWHQFTGLLREEIKKRGLKGYLVYTPRFSFKKNQMQANSVIMADVIEKGIKDNPTVKKFDHEGFKFHKIESLENISLSYSDGVRSVDSRGAATTSFIDKLPTKNKQVDVEDHERVLLVVNWAFFVDTHAAIRALSSFDFEKFENIDKIYFEENQNNFSLIFDRSVVDAIKARANVENPDALKLLMGYLRSQLDDKSENAFDFVKTVGTASGNLDWLSDNGAKENLIRFAQEFPDERIDDAMWVVRMLQNDPNPNPSGANDPDDPEGEHNYHARALRNEDVRNITTVRGNLCWLMSRIVAKNKPEYYTEIIEIIQRYVLEDNLYIRAQATYPLIELVKRKDAIKNQDGNPFDWKQEERDLVRKMPLKMLRDNAQYPRVIEALLNIFLMFRDLTEAEAEEVLHACIATEHDDVLHDLAALIPYFALFRKNDFPRMGTFNPRVFEAILKDQIANGKPALKSSLTWHFWKMLEEKMLPYDQIREYVLLFWANGYDSDIASMFGLVFEQLAIIAPEDAKDLFEKMAELLKIRLKDHPEERHQAWVNGTEEIVALLTNEPDRLLKLVNNLKKIWLVGGTYIGDIPKIFESYAQVPEEDKERVKTELKKLYDEMRSVNIHIQPVDWNK